MISKIFPTMLTVLFIAAGTVYLFEGDWRKTAYHFAAAIIQFVVTY